MDNNNVDILVIGAGASSAAAVSNLSSLGVNILCVEQGDWMNTNEYPSNFKNQQTIRDQQFNQSPNIRKRETDYPINEEDSEIDVANFNGVGGGTILYSGHFTRMKPSNFCVKFLYGVGEDWPLSYNTLEPYFAQKESDLFPYFT